MKNSRYVILTFVALALTAQNAHAYLDPASGSMILQLLVGGVAGLAVMVKLYWRKLAGLFGNKRQDDETG